MTPDSVWRRAQGIRLLSHDPEAAHAEEDQLWRDVLEAIANGAQNPIGLAHEALRTRQIKFPRWCA
jgi:hypothetical protein